MFDGVVMDVIAQRRDFVFVTHGMFPKAPLPHRSFVLLLTRDALLDAVGWVKTHPTKLSKKTKGGKVTTHTATLWQSTSGRTQPNTARFDNGQPPLQLGEHLGLLQQRLDQPHDERGSGITGQFQDHNPSIGCRDIVANVSKTEVSGNEADPTALGIQGNLRILRTRQTDIAHVGGVMPVAFDQGFYRSRQVCIDQEMHGVSLRGWQRVMLFLCDDLAGIGQRCADILFGDAILLDDLVNAHSASQAAEDTHDRHPSPANDRFPMLNGWVDQNTVVHTQTLSHLKMRNFTMNLARTLGQSKAVG